MYSWSACADLLVVVVEVVVVVVVAFSEPILLTAAGCLTLHVQQVAAHRIVTQMCVHLRLA